MKILVLTGSPHPDGTTALLADEFCSGVKETEHELVRFDTAQLNIHPCIACDHCRKNDNPCIFEDDMAKIYPHLLEADLVVLVTPLYYFGMSAQLKMAIDRFYAVNAKLRSKPKQSCLFAACGDHDEWAMEALVKHYELICRYLNWENCGTILSYGCSTKEDVMGTDFPKQARDMGAGR